MDMKGIQLYCPHLPPPYFITTMASSSDNISLPCTQNVVEWVPEGFVSIVRLDNEQYIMPDFMVWAIQQKYDAERKMEEINALGASSIVSPLSWYYLVICMQISRVCSALNRMNNLLVLWHNQMWLQHWATVGHCCMCNYVFQNTSALIMLIGGLGNRINVKLKTNSRIQGWLAIDCNRMESQIWTWVGIATKMCLYLS